MGDGAGDGGAGAAGAERLVVRRHRRRAVDGLVVEGVLVTVVLWAVVVSVRSGPVDYRWLPAPAALTGAYWVLLVLPAFVFRLTLGRRRSLVLSAEGIEGLSSSEGPVRWEDVAGLRAVRRLTGRRVRVVRRGGSSMLLHAPRSGWLPDPRFDRDLAAVREWAVRHGAGIDPGGPATEPAHRLRSPVTVAGLVLVVALAGAGLRVADRGVVGPSTPIADGVTDACPALDAAGLDRHWPADTRRQVLSENRNFGPLHLTECRWGNAPGVGPDPFDLFVVTITRYEPHPESSAVAAAARSYDRDRSEISDPRALDGIGDEAVAGSGADSVVVAARKANVTVFMWARLDSRDRAEDTATSALRALTASIIADVRLGSTERRGDG